MVNRGTYPTYSWVTTLAGFPRRKHGHTAATRPKVERSQEVAPSLGVVDKVLASVGDTPSDLVQKEALQLRADGARVELELAGRKVVSDLYEVLEERGCASICDTDHPRNEDAVRVSEYRRRRDAHGSSERPLVFLDADAQAHGPLQHVRDVRPGKSRERAEDGTPLALDHHRALELEARVEDALVIGMGKFNVGHGDSHQRRRWLSAFIPPRCLPRPISYRGTNPSIFAVSPHLAAQNAFDLRGGYVPPRPVFLLCLATLVTFIRSTGAFQPRPSPTDDRGWHTSCGCRFFAIPDAARRSVSKLRGETEGSRAKPTRALAMADASHPRAVQGRSVLMQRVPDACTLVFGFS